LDGSSLVTADMLHDARADPRAFSSFPAAPWKKIWSTNPLERLKKIKRGTNVAGIFPNEASLTRVVTAVIAEIHDEWQVCDRRYLCEASMNKFYEQPVEPPATNTPSRHRVMNPETTARRSLVAI
jgi:putative transposase